MINRKPVIGIIPTYNLKNEDNDPYQDRASFVRMYEDMVTKCGGIPIGILSENIEDYFDLCDGYIWPGGSCIFKCFYNVFDDILKNNKPFLGVCLGMQALSTYFNIIEDRNDDKLSLEEVYYNNKETNPYLIALEGEIKDSHSNYVTKDEDTIEKAKHKIIIEDGTFMSEIYKEKEINVPSMHSIVVARVSDKLKVSSKSEDGIIESLEYSKDGACVLGVQYHPELIKDYKIFNWFIENVKKHMK